jgi:hypothetical protein
VYEPITVQIDKAYGGGTYRFYSINFVGRLVRIVEAGHTTTRLYEWADRGRLLYLVHVKEDKPGRPLRRTLYPFINTHSAGATPRKGYTAREVSRAYPEFAEERSLRFTQDSANEVEITPELGSDFGQSPSAPLQDRDVLPL